MFNSPNIKKSSFRTLNENEVAHVTGGWGNPTVWDDPLPDDFQLPEDDTAGPLGGLDLDGIYTPGSEPGTGNFRFIVATDGAAIAFDYNLKDDEIDKIEVTVGEVSGLVDLDSGALTGKYKVDIFGGGQAELEVSNGPVSIPGPGNSGVSGTSGQVNFTWRF